MKEKITTLPLNDQPGWGRARVLSVWIVKNGPLQHAALTQLELQTKWTRCALNIGIEQKPQFKKVRSGFEATYSRPKARKSEVDSVEPGDRPWLYDSRYFAESALGYYEYIFLPR